MPFQMFLLKLAKKKLSHLLEKAAVENLQLQKQYLEFQASRAERSHIKIKSSQIIKRKPPVKYLERYR
jgi:hypothetical protein